MKKRITKLTLFLVWSSFYLIFSVAGVSAVTTQGISLEPAFQELTLNASDAVITGTIQLHNDTDTQLPVELLAFDIQQIDANGNISFIEKPDASNTFRVAEFIIFEKNSFILEPKSKTEIPFKVQNSPDLSPGGHYGTIIARFKLESGKTDQKVFPAISSLVLLRKMGGEQYHISLSKVNNLPSFFTLYIPKKINLIFTNDGNIHTIPYGTVKFTNVFGDMVFKGIINEGSSFVLPKNQREISINLQKLKATLPLMFYTVSIQGKTRPGEIPYNWETSFFYTSPFVIGIFLATICILVIVYKKKFKKRHENEETKT